MILITAIFLIVFQQSIEALANKVRPVFNVLLRRFHILVILFYFALWAVIVYFLIPNEIPYWKLFLGYWFIAFMISDLAWNITTILLGTDISIWYYGTTKWYDRFMTRLASWGWFVKFCFGAVGLTFLITK